MQTYTEQQAEQRHTEHAVTVEAPTSIVYDVLSDIEGYVQLFPPTQAVDILEESIENGSGYQVARLVVEIGGEELSWVSRRDLDGDRGVIAYQQLETAPLMANMGGEWRCFPFGERRTQLIITHDFAARKPANRDISLEEADEIVQGAVERNSHADLAAVKAESERRYNGAA